MNTDLELCMTDDAYASDSLLDNIMQSINSLKKLSNNWQYRAQVKQDEFDEEEFFDNSKDDFLTDLLPFKDHPLFTEQKTGIRSTQQNFCGKWHSTFLGVQKMAHLAISHPIKQLDSGLKGHSST